MAVTIDEMQVDVAGGKPQAQAQHGPATPKAPDNQKQQQTMTAERARRLQAD
jgi:hypothetical protein